MTDQYDQDDDDNHEGESIEVETESSESTRARLEHSAEQAIGGLDRGLIDVLGWLLDTETRTRIYVYLRQHADSTSEEIAEGTGLYPSTVREALSQLHDEEILTRDKRENAGAGNNPFEYRAIAPSDLVGRMANRIQDQLNSLVNLDNHLLEEPTADTEPITISVDDPDNEESSANARGITRDEPESERTDDLSEEDSRQD